MASSTANNFPLLPNPARILLTSFNPAAKHAAKQQRRSAAITISRAPIGTPLPANRLEAQPKVRVVSQPPAQDPAFGHSSSDSSSSSGVSLQGKAEVATDRRDSAIAERRSERSSSRQSEMPPIDDESRQTIFDDGVRPLFRQSELNFHMLCDSRQDSVGQQQQQRQQPRLCSNHKLNSSQASSRQYNS